MGAMVVCHIIGPLTPDRDLYPFYGIQDKQTEFTVKNIEIQYIVEVRVALELVRSMIFFKGEPIGTEAVIIEVPEVEFCLSRIINSHSPLLE